MPITVDTYGFTKQAADVKDLSEDELRAELERLRSEDQPTSSVEKEMWKRTEDTMKEFPPEEEGEEDVELSDEQYREFLARLTSGECLICGGETEYEELEGQPITSPTCRTCAEAITSGKAEIPKEVQQFLKEEGKDLDDFIVDLEDASRFEVDEEPMDPRQIEEQYRQVSEEEWEGRHTPVSMPTHEKMKWPEKGVDADWLEQKERGGATPPAEQEMYLPEAPPGDFGEGSWDEWLYRKKSALIAAMTKVANSLDEKGFYDEANELDEIIRKL